MNCVSFYRNEGCYNLCNSKEKSAQYVFDFGKWNEKAKKLGLKKSFLIEIDEDPRYSFPEYTALELANEIDSIISGYWIHSEKPKAKELVNFLQDIEEENMVEMCKDMISKTELKLVEWKDKLKKAEYDLSQKYEIV